MQSGNAHIVQPHHFIAVDFRSQGSFLCNRNIACPSGSDNNFANTAWRRYLTDNAAAGILMILQRMRRTDDSRCFRRQAGDQYGFLPVFQHCICNTDDLFRRFARTVNNFRSALPQLSMHIHFGIANVLKGLHFQFQQCFINRNSAVTDTLQYVSDIAHHLTSKSREIDL